MLLFCLPSPEREVFGQQEDEQTNKRAPRTTVAGETESRTARGRCSGVYECSALESHTAEVGVSAGRKRDGV